jgi:uncharacterized protein (TIGR02246 family)
MKARIIVACLTVATCVALSFALMRTNHAADPAPPDNKDGKTVVVKAPSEDETAIRDALAAYSAAFAKGEVAAVLAMWTPDGEFTDDDGTVYRGREKLAPLFTKGLPSFKGYKITSKATSISFIKPDVALVDGEQTFTPPQGEPDISRFTSIWVKADGKWLIRSARDLTAEPTGDNVAGRMLRELDWMVGEWVSEGNDTTVHLKVSWTLNKSFQIWEYEVKRKQGDASRVTQWVGWDPQAEQIKSWVFDDQGGNGEAMWTRIGNTWTADATGVLPDGGTGSSVNVLKYVDDKNFVWQSNRREADGQPLPDVEAKFTRPAAKP